MEEKSERLNVGVMDQHSKTNLGAVNRFFKPLARLGGLAGIFGLLLATGCTNKGMKGTPFYSGEYPKRQGPAEQRVNAWPAFYYRDPALSVLWPLFEITDDHLAIRPLLSVYGLDTTERQYNVLWPLAQFDHRTGKNHVFPLFWSDNYYVVFPLYWHYGEPWGEQGGSDSLFPLWMLNRNTNGHFNLYSPWPLVHFWSETQSNASGSMVFPLYWHKQDNHASRFVSLLWYDEVEQSGDFRRMLFPLYFHAQDGENTLLITPLWAQGNSGQDHWRGMVPFWLSKGDGASRYDLSCAWPLTRFWSDSRTGEGGSRVLPLYSWSHATGESQFLSLPWSYGSNPDGHWRLAPLFYQSSNTYSSTLITPLWSQGHSGKTGWDILVPLWYRNYESTNRFNLYTWPFTHIWSDRMANDHGSTVFPLFWQHQRQGISQFTSLLWLSRTEPNGDGWRLLPPLFYQESEGASSALVTPLFAHGRSATNAWTAIIPLCYWNSQKEILLSPLWANWRKGDTQTRVAPWLLSWQTREPERNDFILLGGLARFSSGPKAGADYVFPLFYNDSTAGTLLSPVWIHWRNQESKTTLAPWLLSWKTQNAQRSDLWMAAGLARASWGEKPGADYVLPLFYHDSQRLLTPLFGKDDQNGFRYFATPLAGMRTGKRSGSWVFPLYNHSQTKATGDVKDNFLFLGGHSKEKESSRSWLIPLFYWENVFRPEPTPDQASIPTSYGQRFFCLPFCWYKSKCYIRPSQNAQPGNNLLPATQAAANQEPALVKSETNAPMIRDFTRSHGAFPLWSYSAQSTPAEGRSNRDQSVLLWLYDYKHEFGPLPGSPEITNDYTRSRVLWRLWHSEKLNGNVSVDVFPAFTYDHKTDGFKKISFLWRFFRYERNANDEKKLDVLFIPVKRG